MDALAFSETHHTVGIKSHREPRSKKQRWPLTYELHRSVQPGQDLLAEGVVDRNSEKVRLWDEVRFGAGVAGVQDVADAVLLHQILRRQTG